MRIFYRVLLALILLLGLGLAVILYYIANPKLPAYRPAEQVHYLEQWSAADRQTFYYTPQGTQVKGLRYEWFTALELPFSEQRFAAPEYLGRFGFLVDPRQQATADNPGNLPVGFTRHQNPGSGEQYLDITCAACHTGELRYTAVQPSMCCPPAYRRYVAAVSARRWSPASPPPITTRGNSSASPARSWATNMTPATLNWNDTHRGLYPTLEGPGRTDAFGRIANASFGDAISDKNYRVANAPVDYPQLWDIWTFDWVQWTASAQQPMRSAQDRRNPATPQATDLARGTVRQGRPGPSRPGPCAVWRKLRRLPRPLGQRGKRPASTTPDQHPAGHDRHRPEHRKQHRRPSL